MSYDNQSAIGFWAGRSIVGRTGSTFILGAWEPGSEYPIPVENSCTLSDDARAKLVRFLELPGHRRVNYRGASYCRLCGVQNGSEDVSDGRYTWPSGLAHYITAHKVGLPSTFVQHAIAQISQAEVSGASDHPELTMPRRRYRG